MKEKIFVKDIGLGHDVDADFLLLSQSRGQTSRGSLYLNLDLADKTGHIPAKVWDATEEMAKKFIDGKVLKIRGSVDSYRGNLQLVVREAKLVEEEGVNWADFLKTAPRPLEVMKGELWALVDTVTDYDFKRLLERILRHEEVMEKFYTMPAAKSFHHAYLSGLLEHSLSVARLAQNIGEHYGPLLNKDLLLTGAILHDLGKIWEFTMPPKVDYSTMGRLLGHLVMGADFIKKMANELTGFPPDKLMLLEHLILSHHGEYALGAVRTPQILEALILHSLDNMDAKLNAVASFIDGGNLDTEGWTSYHRLLESYFLRTPDLPVAPAASELEPEKPWPQAEAGPCAFNRPEDERLF